MPLVGLMWGLNLTWFVVLGIVGSFGGLQGLVLPLHFALLCRLGLLGLVLTALACGMLAGAALYSALGRRLPAGAALWTAFGVTTTGLLLMASLHSAAVVFTGAAALGLGNAVLGAVVGVLQVRRTADAVCGRVLGVNTALLTIAAPAGIVLAGVLAVLGSRALRDLAPEEVSLAQR